jgi:hypothetical protein
MCGCRTAILTIVIIVPASGEQLTEFRGGIQSLSLSCDDQWLAADGAEEDCRVTVWNTANWQLAYESRVHPDGMHLACAARSGM